MNEEELQQGVSTGFIESEPQGNDYVLGAETGIVAEPRLLSGDWTEFLPSDERQYYRYFDSFACVTFSALNCLETQMNFLRAKNLIPKHILDRLYDMGYFDENGKFNCSDRFTAKMSGTTITGNYFAKVWDSIRNHGVLPERDWLPDEKFEWDAYYAEIPEHLKKKALEFKALFDVRYEWLPISDIFAREMAEWLKVSPVQVGTPVCRGWNGKVPIANCGLTKSSHATMIFGANDDGSLDDFDHYSPFQKKLAQGYPIPHAMRSVVYVRPSVVEAPKPIVEAPATAPVAYKHKFSAILRFGQKSSEIAMLQDALKIGGFFPSNVVSSGLYGNITRISVLAFQRKYAVAAEPELKALNGKLVGAKTIAKLNELFNH